MNEGRFCQNFKIEPEEAVVFLEIVEKPRWPRRYPIPNYENLLGTSSSKCKDLV